MSGTNGNGNGGSDDGDEEWQDRTPTLVGHPENRPILKILGNLRISAREHSRELHRLYLTLRAASQPAPGHWAQELLAQLDKHQSDDAVEIEDLRRRVSSGG
jgi:hypothetical protein